jgi:hypothetical protein
VLFIEVQGASDVQAQGFALKKKWLGVDALWTTERPFDLGLDGIPQCALLSPSGEIVLSGYTNDIHSKVADKIDEFVKKPKARKDLPASVAKVVSDFDRGNYGAAMTALASLASGADKGAAEGVQAELSARLESKIARIEAFRAAGYLEKADALAALLTKSLAGNAEWSAKLDEPKKALAAPEMAKEREAEKALAAATKKLFTKGPDKGTAKSLEAVASKHTGTKVAERASELAKIANAAEGARE